MVMIILFCNINGRTRAGGGAACAFAIHIALRDYIKRVFCHIWLMYLVFLKTGLKYENWQKWGHYKELSIFNNLLKRGKMKWRAQRSCSEIQQSGFGYICNQCYVAGGDEASAFLRAFAGTDTINMKGSCAKCVGVSRREWKALSTA